MDLATKQSFASENYGEVTYQQVASQINVTWNGGKDSDFLTNDKHCTHLPQDLIVEILEKLG